MVKYDGATNPPQWNKIPALNRNNIKILKMKSTLINSYIQNFKDKRPNGTILIARSNTAVQQSNAFIRQLYQQQNPTSSKEIFC
jgi:hypothetical protein